MKLPRLSGRGAGLAALAVGALAVGAGIYTSTPPASPQVGRWYRVALRPGNTPPGVSVPDQMKSLGFVDVLTAAPDPRGAQAIARFVGLQAGAPRSPYAIASFVDLLDPPFGARPPPALAEPGMPRDLYEAYAWALSYDVDPVRLGALSDAIGDEFYVAKSFVEAKREALRRQIRPTAKAAVAVMQFPKLPPAPVTRSAGVGSVWGTVVELAASNPFTIGPVAVAAALTKPGRDFYESEIGQKIIRSYLDSTYAYFGSAVGAQVGGALGKAVQKGIEIVWSTSAKVALDGKDVDQAASEAVGETVAEGTKLLLTNLSGSVGEEARRALAAGEDTTKEFLAKHPELSGPIEENATRFTSAYGTGISTMYKQLAAVNIYVDANDPASVDRARQFVANRFGAQPDLGKFAQWLGTTDQKAAALVLDTITKNPTLSTVKGRTFDPITHEDLSPYSTRAPTAEDLAVRRQNQILRATKTTTSLLARDQLRRNLAARYRVLAAERLRGGYPAFY